MWSLIPANDAGGAPLRMLVGKKYTLGRTMADFIIHNDKSISRIHATLEVTHPETNVSHPHKPPLFTVRDASRFGTVIRDQMFNNSEHLVRNGDTIKFGTVSSIYSAVYESYVVTTSCLDQGSKKQTKLLVTRLGGHAVNDWRRECQLLIMTSLSVTVKVICALVSLKPIVTVQYLEKLVDSIEARTPHPNPEEYTPPLAESQLNPQEVSFKKDERRKTLFKGKVFIFLNPKQFKKLNVPVELAGGTPMLMEEGTDDNEDGILVEPSTCVMHADPNDTSSQLSQNAHDWVKHVFKVLRKHGRRPIPDCELGFAVLYCSTDPYCNPLIEAAPSQNMQNNLPSQTLTQQVAPSSRPQGEPRALQHEVAPLVVKADAPSVAKPAEKTTRTASVTITPQVRVKEERKDSPSHKPVSPIKLPATPPRSKKPRATPGTPPITKFFSKKRQHEDEGDEDVPVNSVKIPWVKEDVEETRQRRSTRRSPSPRPETSATSTHRAQARTQAQPRGPARRSVSPETPAQSPSPSPPPPQSPSASTRRSATRAAPPVSSTTTIRRSPRSRSPSPTPNPTRARRTAREKSPSPVPTAMVVSPKSEPAEEEEEDDLDGFDTYKPRARRRRVHQENEGLAHENMKSETPSPVRVVGGEGSQEVSSSSRLRNGLGPTDVRKTEELKAESSPHARHVKEGEVEPELSASRLPETRSDGEDKEASRRAPSPLPGGFLTTYNATPNEAGDCEAESTGKMVTVVTQLTIPRRQRPAVVPENNNTINGKAVKNFKKFKKAVGVGGSGLPRILGGADLRPHVNDPREVNAWFEEQLTMQQTMDTKDKETDDLFNWQPEKKSRRKNAPKR